MHVSPARAFLVSSTPATLELALAFPFPPRHLCPQALKLRWLSGCVGLSWLLLRAGDKHSGKEGCIPPLRPQIVAIAALHPLPIRLSFSLADLLLVA